MLRAIYLKSLQRYVLADALLIAWSVSLLLEAFGASQRLAGVVANAHYQNAIAWYPGQSVMQHSSSSSVAFQGFAQGDYPPFSFGKKSVSHLTIGLLGNA